MSDRSSSNSPLGRLPASAERKRLQGDLAQLIRDRKAAAREVRNAALVVANEARKDFPSHASVRRTEIDLLNLEELRTGALDKVASLHDAIDEIKADLTRISTEIQEKEEIHRASKSVAEALEDANDRRRVVEDLQQEEDQLTSVRATRTRFREQLDQLKASQREAQATADATARKRDDRLETLGVDMASDPVVGQDIRSASDRVKAAQAEVVELAAKIEAVEIELDATPETVVSGRLPLIAAGVAGLFLLLVVIACGGYFVLSSRDGPSDTEADAGAEDDDPGFTMEDDKYANVVEHVYCGEGDPPVANNPPVTCTTFEALSGRWRFTTVITKAQRDDDAGRTTRYEMDITVPPPSEDSEGETEEAVPTATLTRTDSKGQSTGTAPISLACDEAKVTVDFAQDGGDPLQITFRFTHAGDTLTGLWNTEGRSYRDSKIAGGLTGARGSGDEVRVGGLRSFSCKRRCDLAKGRIDYNRRTNAVRWVITGPDLECRQECIKKYRRAVGFNSRGLKPFEAGDYKRALKLYRTAADNDRSYAKAWYNTACAAAHQGDAKIAAEGIHRFALLRPDVDALERMAGEPSLREMRTNPEFVETLKLLKQVTE